MPAKDLVPTFISVELRATTNSSLEHWCGLNKWTPFQAACLICGFAPGPFKNGKAIAYGGLIDQGAPQDDEPAEERFATHDAYEPDVDYGTQLKKLTTVIVVNHKGASTVDPLEIIDWAIRTGNLDEKNELARITDKRREKQASTGESALGTTDVSGHTNSLAELRRQLLEAQAETTRLTKAAKDTNKRFALTRERMYAAALHRLVNEVQNWLSTPSGQSLLASLSSSESCVIDGSGRVVAARLAEAIHDRRTFYNFPEGDKDPALTVITDKIALSLSDPAWRTHWNKQSLDVK